jgi:hypothetical protein
VYVAATEVRPHRSMAMLYLWCGLWPGRAVPCVWPSASASACPIQSARWLYLYACPARRSTPTSLCCPAPTRPGTGASSESSRARRMQARRAVQPQAHCSSDSRQQVGKPAHSLCRLCSFLLRLPCFVCIDDRGRSASAPSPPLTTRALRQKHA